MNFLLTAIIVNKLFIYLIGHTEAASYNHGKRELNFVTYPNSGQQNLRNDYNGYNPGNTLEDPGYTQQNDNSLNSNQENLLLGERSKNATSYQNLVEFNNPAGQMFQLLYVPLNPNNAQQPAQAEQLARTLDYSQQQQQQQQQLQQIQQPQQQQQVQQQPQQQQQQQLQQPQQLLLNGNTQNLAYSGPQLFPTQTANANLISKPSVAQTNFNNIPAHQNHHINYPAYNYANIHHRYPTAPFMSRYNQISKMPSKMEAPFMASQFLGFGQQPQPQQQPHPQQQHQQHVVHPSPYAVPFPPSPHYHQQIKPVHETAPPHSQLSLTSQAHYQPPTYNRGNLMFMAPNNLYDLYRKSP